jgi:DNA-binding transcriptional MocR family regulator
MKIDAARLATLIGTWSAGAGPLYARLARALEAAVARGELPAGDVLPTERELARRLSVSRTTVVGAYGALKEAGLLGSRQGRGTWVAGPPEARPSPGLAFSAELYGGLLGGGSGLIELTAACPPPTSLVSEVLAGLSRAELAADLAGPGYLPAGTAAMRERVAERMTGDGLPTRVEQVLMTTGSHQGVGLAAALLGAPGASVLVEEATYPGALDILRGAGMRPIAVPLDAGGVVCEALEGLLDRVRPAFVYLVPVYQNPTGSVLSASRARRVAELSARYRVPVVEDLALRDLRLDERPLPSPVAAHGPDPGSVVLGTTSKVLWAGLRIGWMRAERPVVERLMRLKIVADMGSSVLSQTLAAALLPRIDEAVAERRAFLRERLAVLTGALGRRIPEWTWEAPRGGCTLWVRMPGGDARAFRQVAQRYGVNVVPGQVLSAEGRHEDRLRIPFVHEPPVIEEAVRRLAAAWEAYASAATPVDDEAAVIV